MIEISQNVIDLIFSDVTKSLPNEGCGYLLGNGTTITESISLKNVATNPLKTFEFLPKDQFDTVRYARANNLTILGVYHSHPNGKCFPSQLDIKLADEDLIQMIVVPEKRECNLFKINNEIVVSVEYSIK